MAVLLWLRFTGNMYQAPPAPKMLTKDKVGELLHLFECVRILFLQRGCVRDRHFVTI